MLRMLADFVVRHSCAMTSRSCGLFSNRMLTATGGTVDQTTWTAR